MSLKSPDVKMFLKDISKMNLIMIILCDTSLICDGSSYLFQEQLEYRQEILCSPDLLISLQPVWAVQAYEHCIP